jgi:hypothetical protein
MSMPWDRFKPEPADVPPEPVFPPPVPVEPELPYTPPPDKPAYEIPPEKPLPDILDRVLPEGTDFGKILKDAFSDALVEAGTKLREGAKDYARESWEGIKRGETVDVLHPTITAEDKAGRELVIADAKSRSWRTLVQGLIFDVFAGIVAAVAVLTGADPFQKETWIAFGVLLLKSVVSAVISYFMRLRITPTIRTPGEKMAIMPVPRPMVEDRSA